MGGNFIDRPFTERQANSAAGWPKLSQAEPEHAKLEAKGIAKLT